MAQIRHVLFFAWCLLPAIPAVAQHMNEQNSPCAKAVITSDLVACFEKARTAADAELNSLYATIRTKLNGSDAARLTTAERLWIQYRDANCAAERALYEGGTASSPAYLGCLEAMTRERTKELRITYSVRLK
jgi:uncharacterized protein YecT (DUF1311 family)